MDSHKFENPYSNTLSIKTIHKIPDKTNTHLVNTFSSLIIAIHDWWSNHFYN